jgi:hypothetical protein
MKSCEICEILFLNTALYNTPSVSNEKRCNGCEYVEKYIKNICCCCNKEYENNLKLFTLYGNMCKGCNNKLESVKKKYVKNLKNKKRKKRNVNKSRKSRDENVGK